MPQGRRHDPISDTPTAFKVDCYPDTFSCGQSHFITQEEFNRQMMNAHRTWVCPCCGQDAAFDSDHEESFGRPKVLAI